MDHVDVGVVDATLLECAELEQGSQTGAAGGARRERVLLVDRHFPRVSVRYVAAVGGTQGIMIGGRGSSGVLRSGRRVLAGGVINVHDNGFVDVSVVRETIIRTASLDQLGLAERTHRLHSAFHLTDKNDRATITTHDKNQAT